MQQPSDDEEVLSNDRWMVSFADFMTLLFALFVVLYSSANQDLEKTKEVQESMKKFLSKTGLTAMVQSGGGGETGGESSAGSPIESPLKQGQVQVNPLTRDTLDELEQWLQDRISQQSKKIVLDIQQDPLGVRVVLSGLVCFGETGVRLQPEVLQELDSLLSLVLTSGRKVIVEAHVPKGLKNSVYPTEWEYSSMRASLLVRYMSARHQFKEDRLIPIGYGASRNQDSDSKLTNRIELVLLTEELSI